MRQSIDIPGRNTGLDIFNTSINPKTNRLKSQVGKVRRGDIKISMPFSRGSDMTRDIHDQEDFVSYSIMNSFDLGKD